MDYQVGKDSNNTVIETITLIIRNSLIISIPYSKHVSITHTSHPVFITNGVCIIMV